MNENMTQWIDALRSDDFPQIQGSLCDDTEVPGQLGYCCLGVAESIRTSDSAPAGGLPDANLAEWLGITIDFDDLDSAREWDLRIAIPHAITEEQLLEALGESALNENYQKLFAEIRNSRLGLTATSLNDSYLLNFKQIANLLERYGVLASGDVT